MHPQTLYCAECGTQWIEGRTCQDDFYQMLYWEAEQPALGIVHHLMVLCYNLQHPSLYSPETLHSGKQMLVEFLENGVTPQQMRQKLQPQLATRASARNGNRESKGKASNNAGKPWKITGTPQHHGSYAYPVTWTMTAADVCAGEIDNYIQNVQVWAKSILEALRTSGNLETKTD